MANEKDSGKADTEPQKSSTKLTSKKKKNLFHKLLGKEKVSCEINESCSSEKEGDRSKEQTLTKKKSFLQKLTKKKKTNSAVDSGSNEEGKAQGSTDDDRMRRSSLTDSASIGDKDSRNSGSLDIKKKKKSLLTRVNSLRKSKENSKKTMGDETNSNMESSTCVESCASSVDSTTKKSGKKLIRKLSISHLMRRNYDEAASSSQLGKETTPDTCVSSNSEFQSVDAINKDFKKVKKSWSVLSLSRIKEKYHADRKKSSTVAATEVQKPMPKTFSVEQLREKFEHYEEPHSKLHKLKRTLSFRSFKSIHKDPQTPMIVTRDQVTEPKVQKAMSIENLAMEKMPAENTKKVCIKDEDSVEQYERKINLLKKGIDAGNKNLTSLKSNTAKEDIELKSEIGDSAIRTADVPSDDDSPPYANDNDNENAVSLEKLLQDQVPVVQKPPTPPPRYVNANKKQTLKDSRHKPFTATCKFPQESMVATSNHASHHHEIKYREAELSQTIRHRELATHLVQNVQQNSARTLSDAPDVASSHASAQLLLQPDSIDSISHTHTPLNNSKDRNSEVNTDVTSVSATCFKIQFTETESQNEQQKSINRYQERAYTNASNSITQENKQHVKKVISNTNVESHEKLSTLEDDYENEEAMIFVDMPELNMTESADAIVSIDHSKVRSLSRSTRSVSSKELGEENEGTTFQPPDWEQIQRQVEEKGTYLIQNIDDTSFPEQAQTINLDEKIDIEEIRSPVKKPQYKRRNKSNRSSSCSTENSSLIVHNTCTMRPTHRSRKGSESTSSLHEQHDSKMHSREVCEVAQVDHTNSAEETMIPPPESFLRETDECSISGCEKTDGTSQPIATLTPPTSFTSKEQTNFEESKDANIKLDSKWEDKDQPSNIFESLTFDDQNLLTISMTNTFNQREAIELSEVDLHIHYAHLDNECENRADRNSPPTSSFLTLEDAEKVSVSALVSNCKSNSPISTDDNKPQVIQNDAVHVVRCLPQDSLNNAHDEVVNKCKTSDIQSGSGGHKSNVTLRSISETSNSQESVALSDNYYFYPTSSTNRTKISPMSTSVPGGIDSIECFESNMREKVAEQTEMLQKSKLISMPMLPQGNTFAEASRSSIKIKSSQDLSVKSRIKFFETLESKQSPREAATGSSSAGTKRSSTSLNLAHTRPTPTMEPENLEDLHRCTSNVTAPAISMSDTAQASGILQVETHNLQELGPLSNLKLSEEQNANTEQLPENGVEDRVSLAQETLATEDEGCTEDVQGSELQPPRLDRDIQNFFRNDYDEEYGSRGSLTSF